MKYKKKFQITTLGLVLIFLALPVQAQNNCPFGNLEVPFGGLDSNICNLTSSGSPLSSYVGALANLIIGLIVIIGVISIVIGGYFYMTAGGDASRVTLAKTIIVSAISGIILALAAFVILNTISPQFVGNSEPQPGTLPAGSGSGSGSGAGGGGSPTPVPSLPDPGPIGCGFVGQTCYGSCPAGCVCKDLGSGGICDNP